MKKISSKCLRWAVPTAAVIAIAAIVAAAVAYKIYFSAPIADAKVCIYLTPQLPIDSIESRLARQTDATTARRIATLMQHMGYGKTQRCGYYELSPQLPIYKAARRLMAGSETPIRFTFNNLRTLQQLAACADERLYLTADSLTALLSDADVCASYGFDTATIRAMFIPDTYELYWTVTPRRFLDRMHYYYNAYWNDERRALAARARLTPIEVATLASIVEEETSRSDEMPVVAGLYINRLRRGMLLQADPTVKYAVGDFGLRRILQRHLLTPSPYNTYLHTGLPPAPIRIASKTAMDAVLHYSQHNYLYMCAKDDFSGYHAFARTLQEHNRNAARYHAALNRLNIK